MSRDKLQLSIIAVLIFLLMLPVTGMVPILQEITKGRFVHIGTFEKHLFMSVNMIGAFIFAPIIGIFSDKLDQRKNLLILSFFLNSSVLFLMSLDLSYTFYIILRFVEGCAHISALTLLMASASDRIEAVNSGKIMGLVGASLSLGVAMGAPLGGIIGNKMAINVFEIGSYLLLFETVLVFLLFDDIKKGKSKNHFGELIESIKQSPTLIVPYAFTFIDRMTVGFIVSSLTLYLRQYLNMSPKEIGFTMAIFLIPFSILTYPSGVISKHFNKLKMMMLGSILYGISLMFISFCSIDELWIIMFFCGISSALMFAPSLTLVANIAKHMNKATAMSGFNASGSLGFLLGPVLSGSIVALFSIYFDKEDAYKIVFLFGGLLELVCVFIFLPYLKRIN